MTEGRAYRLDEYVGPGRPDRIRVAVARLRESSGVDGEWLGRAGGVRDEVEAEQTIRGTANHLVVEYQLMPTWTGADRDDGLALAPPTADNAVNPQNS